MEKLKGGDRRSKQAKENQPSDRSLKYGETSDYLCARLARDYPDILAAYENGEFNSVRSAAIAAGIVKVPTPLDRLRTAWKKASKEERKIFRQEIESL